MLNLDCVVANSSSGDRRRALASLIDPIQCSDLVDATVGGFGDVMVKKKGNAVSFAFVVKKN